jgi:hypothetical protein
MLNAGLFSELNGCVSTGKEANVYQAATAGGTDLAVKVYKTSILTFKDRDRCCSLLPSQPALYLLACGSLSMRCEPLVSDGGEEDSHCIARYLQDELGRWSWLAPECCPAPNLLHNCVTHNSLHVPCVSIMLCRRGFWVC